MNVTKELCDTVLTIQRDLRLTCEQAQTISREVGNATDATRRNSRLRVELEQVKRVANDQAQLAAKLQKELDELKKAVIWYEQTEGTLSGEKARFNMFGIAKYGGSPS